MHCIALKTRSNPPLSAVDIGTKTHACTYIEILSLPSPLLPNPIRSADKPHMHQSSQEVLLHRHGLLSSGVCVYVCACRILTWLHSSTSLFRCSVIVTLLFRYFSDKDLCRTNVLLNSFMKEILLHISNIRGGSSIF